MTSRVTLPRLGRHLAWHREACLDLTLDHNLDMIMRKTWWYTTLLPLRVGALIGSRGRLDLSQLLRFGFLLGAAFQIRDDILNITGSPDVYGKEPLGDLREGKPTLMLLHLAAAASPPDRACVARYLLMDPAERTTDVTTGILAMMGAYGSLAFADQFARGIARSALGAFEEAFAGVPNSAARRFVRGLVPYMVDRER
jgi:geranylgeranyl diphosphate synthase, type II